MKCFFFFFGNGFWDKNVNVRIQQRKWSLISLCRKSELECLLQELRTTIPKSELERFCKNYIRTTVLKSELERFRKLRTIILKSEMERFYEN